jgi:DNA polymerase III sliding clamp (beta) subunit (PCNA family)
MNATSKPEQSSLAGMGDDDRSPGHMIARVSAVAVKLVFPFAATQDIRYYLNGVNIRPLDDGSVMVVASDGHRLIVVRDPNGYAEREMIVRIDKDALKHASNAKHTLDVMSNGMAMFSGDVAQPLFIQPGNSLIEGTFPRVERIISTIGYREGIHGAVNPTYLTEALTIAKSFGNSIRFFTRDADSPLNFVLGGLGDLECFGGIMKLRDNFDVLPGWFPRPTAPSSLDEV